jgi:curved DNA-binding protein CbpA
MKRLRTHYENLQVTENASQEVIRGAYKFLSQKWHPDKNQAQREKAERVTKILNDAYTVLSDPEQRRAHDEWIAEQRTVRKLADQSDHPGSSSSRNYVYHYSYALSPELAGHRERYVSLNDGTVMDVRTGLHWFCHSVGERWHPGGIFTGTPQLHDAELAAALPARVNTGEGQGRFKDWRLPSEKELKSLYTRKGISLRRVLDDSIFSIDDKGPYWTLTDNPWLYDNVPRVVTLQGEAQRGDGELVLARVRLVRGPDRAMLAELMHQIATDYLARGERQEAIHYYQCSLELAEQASGVEESNIMVLMRDLALAHFESHQPTEAETWLHQVLERKRQLHGQDHLEVFKALVDLASLHKSLGNFRAALDGLTEAYRILTRLESVSQGMMLGVLYDLLALQVMHGEHRKAETLISRYLEHSEGADLGAFSERTNVLFIILGLLRSSSDQGAMDPLHLYRTFLECSPPPVEEAADFTRAPFASA